MCNIFDLHIFLLSCRVELADRVQKYNTNDLNLIKMGSELLTSKGAADGLHTVIPYTWLSHLFAIQRRRWKYWKLSQEWVIIAAWVQAGPESQNNSVGRNVLWKQTWTLAGTGRLFVPQIQPLLLWAAWYSHAPYFIYSPWINNSDSDSPTQTEVCQGVSECVYVSVHVLYVCDKC